MTAVARAGGRSGPARRIKKPAALLLLALGPAAAAVITLSARSCAAGTPARRQIILVSIDTLRGDHLSACGYPRDTAPHLAALARDAADYREAIPNGCWTLPSHVSLLTGTLPSRHGVNWGWNISRDAVPGGPGRSVRFLAECLRENGLRTLKFAKLPSELGFARGFDLDSESDPFASERIFQTVLDQMGRCRQRDFFMFIHTWVVHSPYAATHFLRPEAVGSQTRHRIDHFRRLYKGTDSTREFADLLRANGLYNRHDCKALYDSGIRRADHYVGRIVGHARRLGIYRDLMIIVTSDHGEHFAEHYPGMFYNIHGQDFYNEFIRVPLIIKYPGGRLKGTRDNPVSLIDVMPTVLDFYGWTVPAFVQGRPLGRRKPGTGETCRVAEATSDCRFEKKMISAREWKYIVTMKTPAGKTRSNWENIRRRRLFNLRADPGEKRNLSADPRYRGLCLELERRLQEIIRESGDPRFAGEPARLRRETLEQMKALGYL